MRAIVFALTSLLLAAPTPEERGAQQVADLEAWMQSTFNHIAPAVVFISTKQGHGSGFFIADDGWILTSAHVVGDAKSVDVVLNDGRSFQAQVHGLARDNIDLALLKIEVKGVDVLELASTRDLQVGTWVGSVGHGTGGIWTFNTGMISNIYPIGSKRPVFQTDIPLNPGNSGGPIFNRHGKVVGVVTAGVKGANNVNYGLQIELALQNIADIGQHCQCWVFEVPKNVAVFIDGESVGSGPTVVVPALAGKHESFAIIDGKKIKRALEWPRDKTIDFK